MLKIKHCGHVYVRETLRQQSISILKNVKTASIFCFPLSERLIFEHINLWFTYSILTWPDRPRSTKR